MIFLDNLLQWANQVERRLNQSDQDLRAKKEDFEVTWWVKELIFQPEQLSLQIQILNLIN